MASIIRVKLFGWLLFRDRLNPMGNLRRKPISTDSSCPCCDHHLEDALHLAILCLVAAQVWLLLGLTAPLSIDTIWDTTTPVGLDINICPTVALAVLWKIWDFRNARVFRHELHSANVTLKNIISDFTL